MKLKLFAKAGKAVASVERKVKINSPQIKVGLGIAAGVATVILACRATVKSQPIIEDLKDAEQENRDKYGDDKKALQKAQATTAVKSLGKVAGKWALPIATGTLSVALILNGFGEMSARYAASVATCGAFQKAFASYRQRVADKIGVDEERDLYHDVEYKDVKVQNEDGSIKTIKKAPVANTLPTSPLAFTWQKYDPNTKTGSNYWDNRPDSNLLLLKNIQEQANRKLQSDGVVTVGQILEMLGMKPNSLLDPMMAFNWGWVYTKNNDDRTSDNYIDFGIWDAYYGLITDDAKEYSFYRKKDLFVDLNAVPLFGIANYEENKLSPYYSQK